MKDRESEKLDWMFRTLYHLLCWSEKTDNQCKLVNEGLEIMKKDKNDKEMDEYIARLRI